MTDGDMYFLRCPYEGCKGGIRDLWDRSPEDGGDYDCDVCERPIRIRIVTTVYGENPDE